MSMKRAEMDPMPEETQRLAWQLYPKGTIYMQLHDALGPIFSDEPFRAFFAKRGRAGHAPWRLAMVTVMQAMEGLTDTQAALNAHLRIDWRYALHLPLDSSGFDYTILSDFRERLLAGHGERLLLDAVVQVAREHEWLDAGGKQRTDSTMVVASVRALSSLESVGESLRATLNALAEHEPDWLLEHMDPEWFERYVHRFELARYPKSEEQRHRLRQQVGEDVQRLMRELHQEESPKKLLELEEVQLLQRVFAQHYEQEGEQVRWRDGPSVSNEERVVSPYDPDARSSRKRDKTWLGYKGHFTETCDQDPARPHLIVNVETTVATTQDAEMLAVVQQHLREQDLNPKEHFVDQGYSSGEQLVKQAQAGTEIISLVGYDPSWQEREQTGYGAQAFTLDWDKRVATCPQGQESHSWTHRVDKDQKEEEVIRFPSKVCQSCPVHALCSRAERGRVVHVLAQPAYEALKKRREEQGKQEFLKRYNVRAGIEGTIGQAVQGFEMRRSPYRGLSKTNLRHQAIGAGINLVRIAAHLQAMQQNKPSRPTRSRTPLARLQELRDAQVAA
jgi:transposase